MYYKSSLIMTPYVVQGLVKYNNQWINANKKLKVNVCWTPPNKIINFSKYLLFVNYQ